jgi:hypothetical protein
MSEMKNFDVKFIAPQQLKPYYRNNKLHDKQQVTLLARVLRTHGFDQPIVADKNMVIIKGHGRWAAALEAKISMVPVVIRDDLEEWQVNAARIADNQAFAMSGVDETKSRSEVNAYVDSGGVGAEFFFDFLKPPVKSTNPESSPKAAVSPAPNVGGLLITCPKCGHVQMESKQ